MPVITGNGSDIVQINGNTVKYQGIAHVKKTMMTEVAAEKVKSNGLQEYFINAKDDLGQTQRILVYGDRLDFKFRSSKDAPSVTINGRKATLVSFDDEPTGFVQGVLDGLSKGLSDALDTIGGSSRSVISNIALAGAAAVAGTTALTFFGHTLGIGAALSAAVTPITAGMLGIAGAAAVLVAFTVMLKGGFSAMGKKPNMETIAAVTEEANQLNAQQPVSQSQVTPRPVPAPAPFAPLPPAPLPPAPVPPAPVSPVGPRPLNPVRPPQKF